MTYFDLGKYSRKVTTSAPEAQLWFDRGLNWLFGFNHGEAIKCFQRALQHDAECAIAHWGISYASGPNYNLPWNRYDPHGRQLALSASYDAMLGALAHAEKASPVERAMIQALPARYPQREAIEDMRLWDKAYTKEMRKVFDAFADDLEVRAVFAESIMNETPWKMWDLPSGKPAEGAGTEECRAVLENAFNTIPRSWDHPGLLHLYVHLMEMSPFPQRALLACDRRFLAYCNDPGVYLIYVIHNFHFVIYGAMFLGQYTPAIAAAEELIATVPEAVLRIESPPMVDFLEGYLTMKQHVLVRFGKWREIIEQKLPEDQALYSSNVAMMHYAKAVAHSALGNVDEAETEKTLFMAAKARVPESRRVHNNTVVDLLGVAEEMLNGELEYRKGNFGAA